MRSTVPDRRDDRQLKKQVKADISVVNQQVLQPVVILLDALTQFLHAVGMTE